jgi:sterol desaturase/sphingolipid hydroxylase (fatty acid hydroxylase superfamily)
MLYKSGFRSFLVDTLCFQLPALSLCTTARISDIMRSTTEDTVIVSLLKMLLGYQIGRLWAAFAHRVMHLRPLYRFTHKRHHVPIGELVASGAFEDSVIEYCLMEVPAMTLLFVVAPPSVPMLFLFFMWHGFSAASDHAGMSFTRENGGDWLHRNFFDGEYHYWHHKLSVVNYAESEWIDKIFGTHHSQRRVKAKPPQHSAIDSATDEDPRRQRGRPP